jgi:hypothetical protein
VHEDTRYYRRSYYRNHNRFPYLEEETRGGNSVKQDQDMFNIEDTVNKLLGYVPQFTVEELQVMTEVCNKWCLNGKVDGNQNYS